jgi:hypothetical protein
MCQGCGARSAWNIKTCKYCAILWCPKVHDISRSEIRYFIFVGVLVFEKNRFEAKVDGNKYERTWHKDRRNCMWTFCAKNYL